MCEPSRFFGRLNLLVVASLMSFITPFSIVYVLSLALKLFNIMISKSVPPNVVTFNTFFWGLCNSRQWDDVKRVWLEMFDKNIFPNEFTFTTLVDSFC